MNISMNTSTNFFKLKMLSLDYPNMKPAFTSHSYEILQYLNQEDLYNLKLTNKFFCDTVECHTLFTDSIKNLNTLFKQIIPMNQGNNSNQMKMKPQSPTTANTSFISTVSSSFTNTTEKDEKKSKFKEKFNFNKSIEMFKGTTKYNERVESAKRNKKI